ncbi:hypothetical protein RUM43_006339, partial [Polyplax serrata]
IGDYISPGDRDVNQLVKKSWVKLHGARLTSAALYEDFQLSEKNVVGFYDVYERTPPGLPV